MIKAPFKRKVNDPTATTTNTSNNTSSKSAPQSNRTSAVNCMHLNDDDEHSDASNSNIYTEIDLCNNDLIQTKEFSVTKSSDEFLTFDILRCLFNESTDSLILTAISSTSLDDQTNCYANQTIQATPSTCDTGILPEQSLYDIDTIEKNQIDDSVATKSDAVSSTFNAIFSSKLKLMNVRHKHFMSKLKLMNSDDLNLDEEPTGEMNTSNESDLTKDDKLSLKKRFRIKFKTGLNFFKDTKVCSLFHTVWMFMAIWKENMHIAHALSFSSINYMIE